MPEDLTPPVTAIAWDMTPERLLETCARYWDRLEPALQELQTEADRRANPPLSIRRSAAGILNR